MSSTPPSLSRRQSSRLSEDTSVTASTGNGQHDIPEPSCSARPSDPRNGLETFDWEDLDTRFQIKMSECAQAEQAIYTEFGTWIRVSRLKATCTDPITKFHELFEAWASTTSIYENERAYKRYAYVDLSSRMELMPSRLRTRMTFVNGAEERLEKRKKHRISSSIIYCYPS
jgi:hypothetical protein